MTLGGPSERLHISWRFRGLRHGLWVNTAEARFSVSLGAWRQGIELLPVTCVERPAPRAVTHTSPLFEFPSLGSTFQLKSLLFCDDGQIVICLTSRRAPRLPPKIS